MQKITPHLWFDKEAEEAVNFYKTVFKGGKVLSEARYPEAGKEIHGQEPGSLMTVSFEIEGLKIMALNGGPVFKFNPSISFFVAFDNEKEIEETWNKLVLGGKVLMEYNIYPWAQKYGWLQDKFGVSWQLSMNENHQMAQKITPLLMFTKELSGKAKEAVEYYTSVFSNSNTEMLALYEKGEGDTEGFIKHARFTLSGENFMAMDSSGQHEFKFNEAISLLVTCKDQGEIDYFWEKLSADPKSEQCGWLKDKFGVSWQIVPGGMEKMIGGADKEKANRAMGRMMQMKKIDIEGLKNA